MSSEIFVALVFVALFSALALLLYSWKTGDDERSGRASRDFDAGVFDKKNPGTNCPLCGELLPRGERVHSVAFPGKDFDLMRIHGCKNCWAAHPNAVKPTDRQPRRCPSCTEKLPDDGYVVARVYHKPNKKTHVQVYGCTICQVGRG